MSLKSPFCKCHFYLCQWPFYAGEEVNASCSAKGGELWEGKVLGIDGEGLYSVEFEDGLGVEKSIMRNRIFASFFRPPTMTE